MPYIQISREMICDRRVYIFAKKSYLNKWSFVIYTHLLTYVPDVIIL